MPAHLVPDFALVTEEMTARLGNEASLRIETIKVDGVNTKRLVPGPFRCVIQAEGGLVMEFGTGPALGMVQRMVADDMVAELNKQLHHDGCWLFNFANPEPVSIAVEMGRRYARFAILWMDRDGDIQFAIDCERPFEKTIEEGPDALAEKCSKAWDWWHFHMRTVLDPQPHEMFKKALGEKPRVLH